MKTIDMQLMRYLNLFEKISKVRTKYVFFYNNNVVFLVETSKVSKAVGEQGRNVKKLAEIIGKRIKVLSFPETDSNIETFVKSLVDPVQFKSLDVTETEVIISAGRQSKASLIGRNKVRLEELQSIIKQYFNKDLKIV